MSAELRNSHLLLIIFVLVGLSIACSLPASLDFGDEDPAVETRVAQTMAARSRGTQEGASDTPISTAGTATPTLTDTPFSTPTITETQTPQSVTINVSGDTFCRTGPGSVYDQKGILNTDEESEILARDPAGNFWYIVNPDNPAENCWVWGNYATPEGPTAGLPVFTPPPTPTPSMAFAIAYDPPYAGDVDYAQVFLLIENTGSIPLQSVTITVEGTQTYAVSTPVPDSVTSTSNSFTSSRSGLSLKLDAIQPGNTAFGRSGEFRADTDLTAAVTVCSQDNLKGQCLSKSLSLPDR